MFRPRSRGAAEPLRPPRLGEGRPRHSVVGGSAQTGASEAPRTGLRARACPRPGAGGPCEERLEMSAERMVSSLMQAPSASPRAMPAPRPALPLQGQLPGFRSSPVRGCGTAARACGQGLRLKPHLAMPAVNSPSSSPATLPHAPVVLLCFLEILRMSCWLDKAQPLAARSWRSSGPSPSGVSTSQTLGCNPYSTGSLGGAGRWARGLVARGLPRSKGGRC